MSVENGKVCCNCRHNIRTGGKITFVKCRCDIDGSWLSYVTVMTHWCRHWSRDKTEVDDGTSMYDTLQEIEEVVEDGKID